MEKTDNTSNRKNFDCEEQSLNDYLQKYARKHSEGDVSQTHVLFDDQNKKVISYYSASSLSVKKESLISRFSFPVKEIPGILIGRLAVDKSMKGQSYGALTLAEVLIRVKSISKDFGVRIVIVDTLNEAAKAFYRSFGFIEFDDDPKRSFISISAIGEL